MLYSATVLFLSVALAWHARVGESTCITESSSMNQAWAGAQVWVSCPASQPSMEMCLCSGVGCGMQNYGVIYCVSVAEDGEGTVKVSAICCEDSSTTTSTQSEGILGTPGELGTQGGNEGDEPIVLSVRRGFGNPFGRDANAKDARVNPDDWSDYQSHTDDTIESRGNPIGTGVQFPQFPQNPDERDAGSTPGTGPGFEFPEFPTLDTFSGGDGRDLAGTGILGTTDGDTGTTGNLQGTGILGTSGGSGRIGSRVTPTDWNDYLSHTVNERNLEGTGVLGTTDSDSGSTGNLQGTGILGIPGTRDASRVAEILPVTGTSGVLGTTGASGETRSVRFSSDKGRRLRRLGALKRRLSGVQ